MVPGVAGRIVSVLSSRVARARSPLGSAALMAKLMQASSSSEWTPAWTIPPGLQASSVGLNEPSTQPRSSPSTP